MSSISEARAKAKKKPNRKHVTRNVKKGSAFAPDKSERRGTLDKAIEGQTTNSNNVEFGKSKGKSLS